MAYGTVTTVDASGTVKGRARLAFRFEQLNIAGDRYEIRSDTVSYTAGSTRTEDAKKIGIGAGAGALIGGLLGGKKGAGTGAAIGGGAGTAMVLTTAGEEVAAAPWHAGRGDLGARARTPDSPQAMRHTRGRWGVVLVLFTSIGATQAFAESDQVDPRGQGHDRAGGDHGGARPGDSTLGAAPRPKGSRSSPRP